MEETRGFNVESIVVRFAREALTLSPREPATVLFSLENRDRRDRYLAVLFRGVPSEWIKGPAERTVTVAAGETLQISLLLQPQDTMSGGADFTLTAHVTDRETKESVAAPVLPLRFRQTPEESELQIVMAAGEIVVAPGGVAPVRFLVRNRTHNPTHVEFTTLGIPAAWVSTSLPVLFLEAGEAREARFDIRLPSAPQVQAGHYTVTIQGTRQSPPRYRVETTFTLIVAAFRSRGRIGVLTESLQFSVAPGSGTDIRLKVRNQGVEPDSFRLGVRDIPVAWISTTAPIVQLNPGEEREVTLTITPPRSPSSRAGRHHFHIRIQSERVPDEVLEVPATLTVAAFHDYDSVLAPRQLQSGEVGQLTITNRGNIPQTYDIEWRSENEALLFFAASAGPEQKEEGDGTPSDDNGQPASGAPPSSARAAPGERATLWFRAGLSRRPIIGREFNVPFSVDVSTEEGEQSHSSTVAVLPMIPFWVAPVILSMCLIFAFGAAFLLFRDNSQSAGGSATATAVAQATQVIGATQTAAANQTRAAEAGQQDTDGDGLVNSRELELGTDPNNPDTDGDTLSDGDEVLSWSTDPLNPDTDGDTLIDGDEVQRGTNPLNPDSDADELNDGDEIRRGTDPLNPDSDGETLTDGDEVLRWSTNPLAADTDNDRLTDAQEVTACPDPLNPDTDGDSIIDGLDLDPCDPNNPSLTATAIAILPTATPIPTLLPPTETPLPVDTPQPTLAPTPPPGLPQLPGLIAFTSNRDGVQEIYASIDLTGVGVSRLTANITDDTEAAWSPDGARIAFVSNRDGNPEIYVMNADGGNPIRLTDNPADDLHPSWSPDGDRIAFSTNRDGDYEIYVMEPDGTAQRPLTSNPSDDREPVWFRGSSRTFSSTDYILFTTDRDGNQEIYRMDPDGTDLINLTNNLAADQNPDGLSAGNGVDNSASRRILFTSDREGNTDIFVMDLDGGNPVNLTTNLAADFQPTWSADGQWVAFVTDRTGDLEIFVLPAAGGAAFNLTNDIAADVNPTWR